VILIEPIGAVFDVHEVIAWLEAYPHALRDHVDRSIVMLGSNELDVDEARRFREQDPRRYPTHMILVDVSETRIEVAYRTVRLQPARSFVEWLAGRFVLKYMDETFVDVSYLSNDLDALFRRCAA
jgi:hypothetical protein